MATLQQQALHWRDRAIVRSEIVSDAWQVFLAWTGRSAEIVLFLCMAVSLVQMIPSITLNTTFTDVVFVIQMIILDIAGFGLNSLAKAVRRAGDDETAKKAETVGTCLIVIMVVSMLSGGVDRLFGAHQPLVKEYIGYLDDVLLLIRVVMTVLYGKIMHSLRDSQQHMQVVADETVSKLRDELAQSKTNLRDVQENASQLSQQVSDLQKRLGEAQQTLLSSSEGQGTIIVKLQNQVADLTAQLQEKQQISADLQSARNTIARLQLAEQQARTFAETSKQHEQDVKDLSEKLSQSERKCEALQAKLNAERVKAQSEKQSVKAPANVTSIDQARRSVKTDDAAVLAYIQSYPQKKVPEIAEHFGVTTRTIYNILKRQQESESEAAVQS
jgi:predicted RNase H-like nuclease (RuvC/YqgF family)